MLRDLFCFCLADNIGELVLLVLVIQWW